MVKSRMGTLPHQGGIWECPVAKSGHCQDSHRPAMQAGVACPGTSRPRVCVGYMLCRKVFQVQCSSGLSSFLLQHVPVPVRSVGSWSGPVCDVLRLIKTMNT